jgi:hypothetical protein
MIDDDDDMLAVPSDRYVVIPHVGVVNVGSIDAADVAGGGHGGGAHGYTSAAQNTSAADIMRNFHESSSRTASRKKKPKRRKPTLYDLYHDGSTSEDLDHSGEDNDADILDEAATMYSTASASTAAGRNGDGTLYGFAVFEVGMDINILLNQVHQNLLRSICLDDTDGTNQFLDGDLICLAAALKHNRSVLSLQLRYLPVTDVSLVPLLHALEQHPSLRALDLSGTKGTRKTGEALRRLACRNTNLLHVLRDETMFQEKDVAVLDEALQFNAMMCADPRSNPYDVKMISKVTEEERAKRLLEAQLNYNPWVHQGPPPGGAMPGSANTSKPARKKGVTFDGAIDSNADDGKDSLLSQRVCGDYIRGSCRYGSRCKYYHPPWTSALSQVAQLQKYNEEEEQKRKWEAATRSGSSVAGGSSAAPSQAAPSEAPSAHPSDARSLRWEDSSFIGNTISVAARSVSGNSTAVSSKRRLREPAFTLDARKVHAATTLTPDPQIETPEDSERRRLRRMAALQRQKRKRLLILSTAICCLCTSMIALAASSKRRHAS